MGEEFPEVEPQRVAVPRKPQERMITSREQAKSAAAREGKSKFSRSSILEIKEVRIVRQMSAFTLNTCTVVVVAEQFCVGQRLTCMPHVVKYS